VSATFAAGAPAGPSLSSRCDEESPAAPSDTYIAGWRMWSGDVVLGLLAVCQAEEPDRRVALIWPDPDGALRVMQPTGTTIPEPQARRWWETAGFAGDAGTAMSGDGAVVAPIAHALGGLGAAVVVYAGSPPTSGAERSALAVARCLGGLLRRSGVNQSRVGAYEALFQIGTEIQAQEHDAERVFQLIIEHARELLKTDVAWLGLVDEEANRVWMKVATGVTTREFSRMEVELGTGIGGVAVRERRPVSVRDHRRYDSGMPSSVHRALNGEGIVSILCAPLMQDDETLGALYVGTRHPRDFDEASASMLSALAAQAAIAIKNARLYQALSDKNETLERTFTVHRLLTDASLTGAGLHQIAFELARLIQRDIVLTLDAGGARRTRHRRDAGRAEPEPYDLAREPAGFVAEIKAGRLAFGTVTAVGDGPLDPVQRNAVEYGATIIALELVREQSALEVEWRLQGELLEELLRTPDVADGLRQRAERLGIELDRPRRIVVLEPRRGTAAVTLLEVVRRALRSLSTPRSALVAQRGHRIVVAVDDGDAATLLERLRAVTSDDAEFCVGVGATCADLRTGLREAEAALALGASSGDPRAFVSYEDLGPLRFLLDAPDTTEMVGMVRAALGVLAEHDAARRSELVKTLRAYLETGGHQPTTAKRCHIHVSTLKYRLARIAEVLDRPLGDPQVRFELGLAFAVLRILDLLGVDPFAPDPSAP
jgi:DNA-binding PucR family transcriptional regulator/putative methionine-R-sulfoxide reductase with GAF domain